MNIKELHPEGKSVSAKPFFKGEQGHATAIRILQGELLKEHITQIPALLICMEGEALFENENGRKEALVAGDFVAIEPMVKHRVTGLKDSHLVLFK